MTIDVAPGVDWTAMIAVIMAVQQVRAHILSKFPVAVSFVANSIVAYQLSSSAAMITIIMAVQVQVGAHVLLRPSATLCLLLSQTLQCSIIPYHRPSPASNPTTRTPQLAACRLVRTL
jgi:hypothetical protein